MKSFQSATITEWIVDAYGCSGDLNDLQSIREISERALTKVGATIVEVTAYQYQPQGLTLCFLLKESHFIVSTWPEFRILIANIFLCNPKMNPSDVWEHFARKFNPSKVTLHKVNHVLTEYHRDAA